MLLALNPSREIFVAFILKKVVDCYRILVVVLVALLFSPSTPSSLLGRKKVVRDCYKTQTL